MMHDVTGEKKNPLGPIGERLRRRVRELRGPTTYKALSERLDELGQPIPPLGLSRLEAGERRVDVDDLVALSLAFEAFPLALMLPQSGESDEEVPITRKVSMSKLTAWRVLGGLLEIPAERPALRAELSTPDAIRLAGTLQPISDAIAVALGHATPGQIYAWVQHVLLDEV